MNFRKIISTILAVSVMLSLCGIGVSALGGTVGNASWEIKDGVLTVKDGDIPDYTASSAPPWTKFGGTVEKIVLGEGVSEIGERAFEDMTAAKSVDLGGVVTIGKMAFSGCLSLESVTLPDTVKVLMDFAFAECTALQTVTLPANLSELGEGVFEACPTLAEFKGGGSRYKIVDSAIIDSTSATLYRLPPASSITEYTVPENITTVANGAFRDSVNLTGVTMPKVTVIGDGAFYGCESLSLVSMPAAKKIGRAAFYGCSMIEVKLPSSLKELGDSAFAFCTALGTADFAGDAPTANEGVFYGTNPGFTVIAKKGAAGFGESSWLGYPVLRHGVYSGEIGGIAWSLDSVTGTMTLTGKGTMPDFEYASDAPWYEYRRMIQHLEINGVTSIGANSFRYSALRSLTLPESVTTVGAWAFSGCEYLETITVFGKAAIRDCAFFACVRLEEAEMRRVTHIGKQAFSGCDSLGFVFTGETAPTLGEYAFDGTDAALMYPVGGTGYSELSGVYSEAYTPGDANGDGQCNIADASHLLKYIAKWNGIKIQKYSSDTNWDGNLNIGDVSEMLKHIAGWDIVIGMRQ